MSHYHHLNPYEREIILKNIILDKSIRSIAVLLGLSPATVSREMKRNQQGDGTYSSVQAEAKYHTRWKGCHWQHLLANSELRDWVQRFILDRQWSPEKIDQRLKRDHSPWKVSYTTIYRGIERHLLDEPKRQPGQRGIARHLLHREKSRHSKGYEEHRGKIHYSHSIDEWPPEANERRVIGHWEADTVVGKIVSECLVTLVDRKTRFLIAAKAAKKTAQCGKEKLIELFTQLPRDQRLTVTPDRGKEFAWNA